jgi:hypothetical protein
MDIVALGLVLGLTVGLALAPAAAVGDDDAELEQAASPNTTANAAPTARILKDMGFFLSTRTSTCSPCEGYGWGLLSRVTEPGHRARSPSRA